MEAVVSRSATWRPDTLRRVEPDAVRTWALTGTIVLYLAIDGGGYDQIVWSQVAIVVWWIVLIGAAWGLLPAVRWTRTAWIGAGLLAGFVPWTALAATWSLSSERSLQELSRVACYLGVLLLGIAIHRDRARAVKHTLHAVAAAVVIVAALAVASRLRPDLFPAAHQTASYLPGTAGRLGWPLNYWNALAALMALGLPLLLATATSARTLAARAVAAGAIPVVALCTYLTFSRGGALAAGAGLLVFFAFSPERVEKLATALVAAAGSGAVILAATHRPAIEQGLTNAAARHQGDALLVSLVIVCAGRGAGPDRCRARRPSRDAAAVAHVQSPPGARAPGRWCHDVRGGGAARRSAGPSVPCLAGVQASQRSRPQPGLARTLRHRQRQRTLRLLEGRDRRHQRPPARRLRRGHVPVAVGPACAVFQLRPECALAIRGDARGDRHRGCRAARWVLRAGARSDRQAEFPLAVRGACARGRVRWRDVRVLRGRGVRLDLAGARAPRGVPGPGGSSARAPACQIQRGRVTAVTPRRDRARGRGTRRHRGAARDGEHRAGQSGGRAEWQLGAGAGRCAHRGAARARRGLARKSSWR